MAGHSKWSNIKHRKAGQDAKKAKVFTKLIRELTVSARDGGGSVEDNPGLRNLVDKAKAVQMPKDTMERAIVRGAGGQDGADLASLVYEGYGPGGVAVMVETMTDNKNRTVAEVRHAFSKAGGNLGTDGSVAYLFEKKGQIVFAAAGLEEAVLEAAIDAGAEDVDVADDGTVEVTTPPEDFARVKDALAVAGFEAEAAEVAMIPQTYTDLDGEQAEKVLRLLDLLEDLDDVTNLYTNANFPDEEVSA
ncbi:MAG TPA: YebC/PmpR family DNA-binding transcriptional regulator [Gammaproteobacteria bacterium]|jgi:YebC/PmpR family DNA-binding regulatory protein|nr:YebC/PmpR family DNA-binding transcriptional regulator [Gammaproteobacteria bacterium]MDA0827127.1 YebC/PmpR family DNA-binding transcriptional regulator [Pseudomonadota bacterium]MDA8913063.1 YebC/PmpR family DNA-binding transcriptional regulator [Pseudomonadales bacterium]MBT6793106.1 YebC/PmpR family DNA-binding transcriptional regulator [Gammaproteobacteria bacterium]MCH9785873.1 YebC/PmpR family DNA-binding transcriptional regulator [Gammaproteobacteria bacterium]